MSTDRVSSVLINQSPRPRLLVRGFDEDAALVQRILALAPTSRKINSLSQVRQAEWDVLVTDANIVDRNGFIGPRGLDSPLSVVFKAPQQSNFGEVEDPPAWERSIGYSSGHISTELRRIKGLPERIAQLTRDQLEPVLLSRQAHAHFGYRGIPQPGKVTPPVVESFIESGSGNVLAGRYRRSAQSECWMLPCDTPDLVPWVRAALAEWHLLAPERFPGLPDWQETARWMTLPERSALDRIKSLRDEKSAALAVFDAREKEIQQELATAREAADSYERALLTTQSDPLKEVVAKALREIGFSVLDADLTAPEDDHLEDLQITDPDAPGWIALGEVKGYTKGAKTEAITQFIRFAMRYVTKNQKSPDAMWYIVNQFLSRDPSTRQPVLHGKDEDISAFALSGGLVIDTVLLFFLLDLVRNGSVTREEARRHLRESKGRFVLPG